MNNVLKVRTQWRLNQLPELIDKLRELVTSQYQEADRAMMGRGEFYLRPAWGDTENAGPENGGPKKYQRLENARLKMEDQMSLGGKCRTGKWRTKCH